MRRLLVSLLIFTLSGLPVLLRNTIVFAQQRSAEFWHVSDVQDPGTHKFSYCAVESSFDNGLSLAFARNRELNTNIIVSFPDKRLQDHSKYRMLIGVDTFPVRDVVGFSADASTLVVPLQHDHKVLDWLQKGKLLELKGPEDAVKFALDGAGPALRQLEMCVEASIKRETEGSGGKPAARPQVDTGPLASNAAPDEGTMVEPLPLPSQPSSPAVEPAPKAAETASIEPASPPPQKPPVKAPAAEMEPPKPAKAAVAEVEPGQMPSGKSPPFKTNGQAPAEPSLEEIAPLAPAHIVADNEYLSDKQVPAPKTSPTAAAAPNKSSTASAPVTPQAAVPSAASQKLAEVEPGQVNSAKQERLTLETIPDDVAEAKAKADTQAKADMLAKAQAQAAEAKARADVQAKIDAQAKADADAKTKQDSDLKAAQAKAEQQAKMEADAKSAAQAQAELAAAKAQLQAKSDAEAKAAADAKAKQDAQLKAAQAKAAEQARVDADAKAAAQAQAELAAAKAKVQAKADAETKAAADAKAKQDAELKAEQLKAEEQARMDAQAKAVAQAQAELAAAKAEVQAKANAEAKAAVDAKAKQDAEVKAEQAKAAQARLDAQVQAAEDAKLAAGRAKADADARQAADAKAKQDAQAKSDAQARLAQPQMAMVLDEPLPLRSPARAMPEPAQQVATPAPVRTPVAVQPVAPVSPAASQIGQPSSAPSMILGTSVSLDAAMPDTAQPRRGAPSGIKANGNALESMLQQVGINASGSTARGQSSFSWSDGNIVGLAVEEKAKKGFVDAVLDDLDQREKRCKGQFSSSIGAPIEVAGSTYAEVATGCGAGGGVSGVILYLEKNGMFFTIAQETSSPSRDVAIETRERIELQLRSGVNYR